jgi:hypothetical protein
MSFKVDEGPTGLRIDRAEKQCRLGVLEAGRPGRDPSNACHHWRHNADATHLQPEWEKYSSAESRARKGMALLRAISRYHSMDLDICAF